MKPVRLQVQGFMPFRLHQEVEFTGLDLFAIVGPTGSGKSALLDAMTFALYGQTPRLGASGMEALISQNEQGASVNLEFEVRGQRHRVARTRGRKASQNALTFESWHPDDSPAAGRWVSRASGKVTETNQLIVETVGLDYQAFTRAVMLPQGEFATFLKGRSSERQKLLGDLLNLGEVGEMASFARDRARTYTSQLTARQALLDNEYADVTQDTLTAWTAELAAADARAETLRDAREDLTVSVARQRELGQLVQALAAARTALDRHEAQGGSVREGAGRAAAARRVAAVLPLTVQARQSALALDRATLAAQRAQDALTVTERAAGTAGAAVQAALAALDRIPALEARITALREAEGLAVRLRLAGGRPDSTHPQPLPWDEARHGQAAQAAEKARKNALERVKLDAERAALQRRRADHTLEEQTQARELTEQDRVKRDGLSGKQRQDALKRERDALQERLGVLAHRHLLHPGEPCPLCEQTVLTVPPQDAAEPAARLAVLNEEISRLELTLEALRTRYNDLNVNTRARTRTLEGAATRLQEEQEHLDLRESDLRQSETTLAATVQGDPADLAARYLAGLAGQLRDMGGQPTQELARVQGQIRTLRDAHDTARQAHARTQAQHAAAAAQADAARTQEHERAREAQAAQDALHAHLAPLGLNAEQAEAAALPELDIQALETAAQTHEDLRQRLSAERADLERRLGTQTFDPAQLSTAERELAGLDAEIRAAQGLAGQLTQRLTSGRERLARKTTLEDEARDLAARLDTWKTLASSLGVSAFQQYLLQEVESRLLSGAGQLLLEISDGRYRLRLQDGEYAVEDLWNAGETRAVRTLSGGETFLASLSLAIALSDYLAGNQILGALFLDEGFGTLDPQALEAVAGALENLRTGGRMVGVITHIESLSERLPHHLLVTKSAAGSSVHRLQS